MYGTYLRSKFVYPLIAVLYSYVKTYYFGFWLCIKE